MKQSLLVLSVICLLSACGGSKSSTGSTATASEFPKPEMLDDRSFKITAMADDDTYGYSKENPIEVGFTKGVFGGPANERYYLNGLAGPNGEQISYTRRGSCCAFKTPNGMMDETGLLDIYQVTYQGSIDTVTLYLNMYDPSELKIPVGFSSRAM